MATLVVRVVAGDLGATGCVDVEDAPAANGAEGVFEWLGEVREELGTDAVAHGWSFLEAHTRR